MTKHILDVIAHIGPEVSRIYIVDDHCPDGSGQLVRTQCNDDRVVVLKTEKNLGVGGATMTGYKAAVDGGAAIVIKLDGDGQMDPNLIVDFIAPIASGDADYAKGNRFFNIEGTMAMPKIRLFGNAILSFMTKVSSGYWDLFDPTNGYTAIHSSIIRHLPFDKISRRYFFETDMLFRLNVLRAVVVDIPMDSKYADEVSNLKISKVSIEFFIKHMRNFGKRIFYNYYLRDMSLASVELPVGLSFFLFGALFGSYQWMHSMVSGVVSAPGTVMLAALPVIVGLQLILSFLSYDISSVPKRPFHQHKAVNLYARQHRD